MSNAALQMSDKPAIIIPFNEEAESISLGEVIPEINQKQQALQQLAEQLNLTPNASKEQIVIMLNAIGEKHGYIHINAVLDYLCFRVNTNGIRITDIEFCDDGDDLEM